MSINNCISIIKHVATHTLNHELRESLNAVAEALEDINKEIQQIKNNKV